MAKKIATAIFLAFAAGLAISYWGQKDWFQYLIAIAIWDLGRTAVQTWYLHKKLTNDKTCPDCGRNLT